MSWCKDDLRRTEEHIKQALAALQDMDRRIKKLDLAGHDTQQAEELLKTMQQSLAVLLRTRSVMERDLRPRTLERRAADGGVLR